MKALPLLALAALAAATSACTHIGQPGTETIYGRGAEQLGKDGSPLLDSGQHAKQVPKEWAAGYAQRGIDDTWRNYWALQDDQGANAHDRPGGGSGGASYNGGQDGATRVYKVDVPEYIDDQGIRRAPRQVSVPITEFIEAVPAREGVNR